MARHAVLSKEELECLSFCVMVKMTYVSSTIKNPTIRRLKELFGLGSTRLSRILSYGKSHGMITITGSVMSVSRIKVRDSFNVAIDFQPRPHDKCGMKMADIQNFIRKAVLLNHIRKQNKCVDTYRMMENPTNISQYKRAVRKIQSMPQKHFVSRELTNRRIGEVLNVKRYKASRLINTLVNEDMVKREYRNVRTSIDPEDFKRTTLKWYRDHGFRGYLFGYRGYVYMHVSNIYSYNSTVIRFLSSRCEYDRKQAS